MRQKVKSADREGRRLILSLDLTEATRSHPQFSASFEHQTFLTERKIKTKQQAVWTSPLTCQHFILSETAKRLRFFLSPCER